MINAFAALAGVLMFTNTIAFTTNSTTGNTTIKDSIYGTTTYLSLTTETPVKDTVGNVVNSITVSGIYNLVSSDGWGYQQNVNFPAPTTAFFAYAPGSLAYHCVTNLQGRTNNLSNPAQSEQMFSSANWANASFVPNSAFWLKTVPEKTAVIISRNGAPQFGFSAISKRHIIGAYHVAHSIGDTVIFVDDNGLNVVRTIQGVTNYPTIDVQVCLLNADLPSTVHPFPLLPKSCFNQLNTATNHPQLQLVGVNQEKMMFPKLNSSLWSASSWLNSFTSPLWLGTNWNLGINSGTGPDIHSGDSGHGVFMLINNDLVIVSDWFFSTGGPNYLFYEDQINDGMHWLSTFYSAGSDYQITTYDLSAFPTY